MWVLITRVTNDEVDGIDLTALKPGEKYDLPSSLASLLIGEGCAEPIADVTDDPQTV